MRRLPHHHIHIVGIGGSGMSAIAKVLLAMGHQISGSDLRGGAAVETLADLGVTVFTGHHPHEAVRADLVVASSAVPEFDEELSAAREAGVPVWRRPKLLAALTERVPTVGATGTHGKTTTSAMLLWSLRAAGLDPSFVVGGDLTGLGTNGHLGESDLLVIEADEAFRTFESLHLDGLVVTNVEAEHLEHFGTEADLLASFVGVARAVTGPVVCCADDPGSLAVAEEVGARTYGTAPGVDWRVTDAQDGPSGSAFTLVGETVEVPVRLSRPGLHFVLDAAGALSLAIELGHDPELLAQGLRSFQGVTRRWEHRGTVAGISLYDDYAHHPTEVRATLQAARTTARGRIWAVFQPHLYSRTERFSEEFGAALAGADVVVVTDVYGARETPVPGVTGDLVAEAARKHAAEVHYVPHRVDLADFLLERVTPGDLVVTMGAGDITLLPTELAARLSVRS